MALGKTKHIQNGGSVFALATLSLVFLLGGFAEFDYIYKETPAWIMIPLVLLVPAFLLAGKMEKRWVLSKDFTEKMYIITSVINIVSCIYYAGTTIYSPAPNLLLPLMPLGLAAVLYVQGSKRVQKLSIAAVVILVFAIYFPSILSAFGV